ncbi:MAG TPA: nicotinate (nicotinamide) nucleotide adenylyltransferase [Candidatus Syntrophosphaera sp.]|jgi:nicotinate-nucleotide adenylyltransferase|nr:nicotinate (nicotinamide) nucleotide adenylyltransferase [Candidatus Syntrophosphaera sp.]
MIRQALLGGSFDPVHNGHLHIAREILRSGSAESVVFLPNARHNFKRDSVLLDYERRRELVAAVLEPGMEVWDDDAQGSGYTSDLLKRLYQKHPDRCFLWVIGSDNLAGLPRWHDFNWLKGQVRFLIIPRPGYPAAEAVLKRIRRKTLKITPSEVSSTLVRARIKTGESIADLVPQRIAERVKQLYLPLVASHDS